MNRQDSYIHLVAWYSLYFLGAVSILPFYITTPDTFLQARSALILANIVNDFESKNLEEDCRVIEMLLRFMEQTWSTSDHKFMWCSGGLKYSFFLPDLLVGMERLSVADENKLKIIQTKLLHLINDILLNGTSEEKVISTNIIWSLAFDADSKMTIKETRIPYTLKELCTNENKDLQKAAHGALWKVTEHAQKPVVGVKRRGHVMLSYSSEEEKLMRDVNKALWAHGYDVWINVEQMEGK